MYSVGGAVRSNAWLTGGGSKLKIVVSEVRPRRTSSTGTATDRSNLPVSPYVATKVIVHAKIDPILGSNDVVREDVLSIWHGIEWIARKG